MRRGDVRFVYGIERRAKASFITPDDESANFSTGKIMSGMGLSNVQHIVGTLVCSWDGVKETITVVPGRSAL